MSVALVTSGIAVVALADNTNNLTANGSGRMVSEMARMLTPQQFVTDAAMGGMKEVQLSKLALQTSQNAEVKNFASRMVKDHTAANAKLMRIAESKGLDFPGTNTFGPEDANWNNPMVTGSETVKDAYLLTTNLPLAAYQDFKHLKSLSGHDFDQAYAGAMVMDHINTVIEFEAASRGLSDPELQQFAEKTLPTLRMHSQMAQKLAADLTGRQTAQVPNEPSRMGDQEAKTGGM